MNRFGAQRWRNLAFFHWPVDPTVLRQLVPRALELDLWNGIAYVGLVAFAMNDVRARGLPFGLDLLETNLRTYVRVGEARGVYFFSLDASSRLAVWGARLGFGLPYFFADMNMRTSGDTIEYALARRADPRPQLSARYRPGAPVGIAQPGTIDHFLIERYQLFVERRARIFRAHVRHEAYPLRTLSLLELHEELNAAAGLPPPGPPKLCHFSDGVDVEVSTPELVS